MKKSDINAVNNVRKKINEVMKTTDEKIVVGWRPEYVTRAEGDVWEDFDGKKWTVKNGITQNVTKLDAAKMPWFCPTCDKVMNHDLDTKFWRIRGHCFDCNIKEEMEIRKKGPAAWKQYEETIMRRNYHADLKDFIQELKDLHRTASSPENILADDEKILMVERWNVDIDKVKADIMEEIVKHEELLKRFEEEYADIISPT
jgi:hypothetical protein